MGTAENIVHEAMEMIPGYSATKSITGSISHALGYDLEPAFDQALDFGVGKAISFVTGLFSSKSKINNYYSVFAPLISTCTVRITSRTGEDITKQAIMIRIASNSSSKKSDSNNWKKLFKEDPEQTIGKHAPAFIIPLEFDYHMLYGTPASVKKDQSSLVWWVGFTYGKDIFRMAEYAAKGLLYLVEEPTPGGNKTEQWINVMSYYGVDGEIRTYHDNSHNLVMLQDYYTDVWSDLVDPRRSVVGIWSNLGRYSKIQGYKTAEKESFKTGTQWQKFTSFFPDMRENNALAALWGNIFGINTAWSPDLPSSPNAMKIQIPPKLILNQKENVDQWVAEKVAETIKKQEDINETLEVEEEEGSIVPLVFLGLAAIASIALIAR